MEGSCHCGAFRFRTKRDPYWVGACYCVDCRKISGSPSTVFAGFKEGDVELLRGELTRYASSEKVTRSFCPQCSSPFAYTYNENPDAPFIPVGVFDDPTSFQLQKHIWVSQKLPWVIIHDDLPQEQ